jgi:hypothetical protein
LPKVLKLVPVANVIIRRENRGGSKPVGECAETSEFVVRPTLHHLMCVSALFGSKRRFARNYSIPTTGRAPSVSVGIGAARFERSCVSFCSPAAIPHGVSQPNARLPLIVTRVMLLG